MLSNFHTDARAGLGFLSCMLVVSVRMGKAMLLKKVIKIFVVPHSNILHSRALVGWLGALLLLTAAPHSASEADREATGENCPSQQSREKMC